MATSGESVREIPWVEKYRPKSLDHVVSQTMAIESLKEFVRKRTLPHLILTGPAGTGKTSAAISLINDLVGIHNVTQDVLLERNASDESRMQDLPALKNFVYHTGIAEQTTFKFVVLDEADNLSNDVQSAFRRIIETAPAHVKFIFMCNYVENIIDPLISRCAVFRFYPLPQVDFQKQLLFIAKNEGVPLTTEMLDAIYYISQGDMRQAINLFQMIVALMEDEKGIVQKNTIDPAVVYEISGFLPPNLLNNLYTLIQSQEILPICKMIENFKGVSSRGLFRQLMTKVLSNTFPTDLRDRLLIALAEYDYRLTLEADPLIQTQGLIAEVLLILRGGDK